MKPPAARHLSTVISAFGRSQPQAPAVAAHDGTLSYRDLEMAATRAAATLSGLGVAAGDNVMVMADRSWRSIAAIAGIWKAGAAYVPVPPRTPAAWLARLLRMISPRLLLSDRPDLGRDDDPSAVRLDSLFTTTGADSRPTPQLNLADTAYVIFTSGSTGTPKGVVISHGNLASYCSALLAFLRPLAAASWGSVSPLWTDLGHTAIFGALSSGGCAHLVDEDTYTSARRFARYCGNLDYLKITPTHLWALIGDDYPGGLPGSGLILGGEPCPPGLIAQLKAMAPELEIINHYGPTECTVGAAAYRIPPGPAPSSSPIPVGRPLPGVRITVRDQAGRCVRNSEAGELWIGGDTVGRYLDQADTADPAFSTRDAGREYRTGDRGFLDEHGHLVLIGRQDRQLKVHGHRVEPAQVEAMLSLLPGVLRVAVLGLVGADELTELAAVIVTDPGSAITADTVHAFAAEQMPEFMIPRHLAFRSSLPYQENGKLDGRLLISEIEGTAQ